MKKVTLELPEDLYKKIEANSKTEFGSVEEYIKFVLGEVLSEGESLSEEDEKKVKERLADLGYLD